MLANIVVAASLNERGVNAVLTPLVIVFSGSLAAARLLPRRGAALPARCSRSPAWSTSRSASTSPTSRGCAALQAHRRCSSAGPLALIGLGRVAMERAMRRLEMQGG